MVSFTRVCYSFYLGRVSTRHGFQPDIFTRNVKMKLGVAVFFMLLAAVPFRRPAFYLSAIHCGERELVLAVLCVLTNRPVCRSRPVLFDTKYYFSDHLWTWHNHAAKHTCWDHGVPC